MLYLYSSDELGKVCVYRLPRTRFEPQNIQTRKRCGRKTVAVWGWFCSAGAGVLHRIEGD